jgi:uroporphyrinogen decarboxylase
MSSKELVDRAIHFRMPERLPFTGSMADTDFSGDTVAIFPDLGLKWWLGGGGTDEWGSQWEINPELKDMGQVKNIVIDDLKDFKSVIIPDALDPERYSGWEEILKRAEEENRYVVCCNGPYIFERAYFLHGFENTLIDIITRPDIVKEFIKHIVQYHLDTIQYISDNFPGRIHGYRGTDDWGAQNAELISPGLFGEIFQPVYKDIFSRIHEAEMDVWMHSCGMIYNIIPLLIEAGLDVVNLMQPNVFPIERLSTFKGKLAFEMCGDIQTTLAEGDKQALTFEIQRLLDACCAEDGGFIEAKLDRMYYEGANITPETGEYCHREYRLRDPFVILK